MLTHLEIRDLLIIDHLDIGFRPGLNVLTGETGAGKSILLDALGFVLGWRGRADLVRKGADQGEVTAVFHLGEGHPARAVLEAAGLPAGEDLILRRINGRDGRKTAYVNDRRASGEVLRALSDTLIELHGQQDDRGLLNPRGHRALLDEFGALQAQRKKVRACWSALREARKRLEELRARLDDLRAEEDFLRHAVAELDDLAPEPGEDAELDARRRRMQEAERIRADVARAHDLVGGDAAEGALNDALRWLDATADKSDGALDAPIAALNRALIELTDAQAGIEDALRGLEFHPGELEACEERLFAIRALARKHGVSPDDLGGFADTLRDRLAKLDAGDADCARQEADLADAQASYDAAAAALGGARAKTAKRLDKAVTGELAPLRMENARFETVIEPGEPGPDGQDGVTFSIATNPGAPAGALNQIASGGELSRFLLALKVCLTRSRSGLTMIFDEIDRGVGGATADAVGRRLARLAENGQVLVVTHSPQVAARGAHHWRVEKRVANAVTVSSVTPVAQAGRIDEIARMLAGDTITEEARAAARALLEA